MRASVLPVHVIAGAWVAFFRNMNLGQSRSRAPDLELPWVDAGGNLTILTLDRQHAFTSLTRMLGVPVTCRGVPGRADHDQARSPSLTMSPEGDPASRSGLWI